LRGSQDRSQGERKQHRADLLQPLAAAPTYELEQYKPPPDYPFDALEAARVTFGKLANEQLDTLTTAISSDEIGDPVRGTSSEWGVSLLAR
jgi:hypothetical protein